MDEFFAAIAVAAMALVGFERRYPYNLGQPLLRPGFWTDFVLYTFAQSWLLGVVIARVITWIDTHTAWSSRHLVGRWPIAFQVLLFLVSHDLYIYLFHRLQHRVPLLWRIHEAHHSAVHVDWLAGARSHALEILINQTVEFAPMVLLGAAPAVPVIKGAISAIWGMFIHANCDVRLGRWQWIVNGPEMHRWHHANDPAAYNKNFSTKFAFWDWLGGTAHFPDRARYRAEGYGLEGIVYPERFPTAYLQHHLISMERRSVAEGLDVYPQATVPPGIQR